MVKHIVMWNFLDEAEGRTKEENLKLVKEQLEGLAGIIREIRHIEVGISFNPDGYDAILYSEFDSREALEIYQNHPAHKEVAGYIAKIKTARVAGDYFL